MSKSTATRIPRKTLQVPVQLTLKHFIIVRIDMTDITKLQDNEKKINIVTIVTVIIINCKMIQRIVTKPVS